MVAKLAEEIHPEEAVVTAAAGDDGNRQIVFPVRPDNNIVEIDGADGKDPAADNLRQPGICILGPDTQPVGKAGGDGAGIRPGIEEEGGAHLLPR